MARRRTQAITLDEARARFEACRQNRKGKAAMPDEFWATAVEVARKEGVSRTSTELREEWNHLKRRIAAAEQGPPKPALPAFLELVAPRRVSRPNAPSNWKAAAANCASS